MYYNKFDKILRLILEDSIQKNELRNYLYENIDCEVIYDLDDTLISDIYFSLKHYVSGEENLSSKEIEYFIKCLNGEIKYSIDDKYLFCGWNKVDN